MLKFSEILEFSKEKFRKIPILKEFEWFEWFEMVRMVRSLADRTFQLWVQRRARDGAAGGLRAHQGPVAAARARLRADAQIRRGEHGGGWGSNKEHQYYNVLILRYMSIFIFGIFMKS